MSYGLNWILLFSVQRKNSVLLKVWTKRSGWSKFNDLLKNQGSMWLKNRIHKSAKSKTKIVTNNTPQVQITPVFWRKYLCPKLPRTKLYMISPASFLNELWPFKWSHLLAAIMVSLEKYQHFLFSGEVAQTKILGHYWHHCICTSFQALYMVVCPRIYTYFEYLCSQLILLSST